MPDSHCTRTSRKCASINSPAKASIYGISILNFRRQLFRVGRDLADSGGPSDRTLNLGRGGAWRCVSLGSVYVAARVGAVCLLACVIACGLCEVPGGAQLRLALVCGWSVVSRREQTEHHKHSPIHSRTSTPYCSQSPPQPLIHPSIQNSQTKRYTNLHSPTQKND